MAKILAFDAATAACSAALWVDGDLSQKFEIAPRRHGELLVPMIDQLLKAASLHIKDCDAVAFGKGPGSFMGIRTAAGLAQGLAFGADIPVIPVSSLHALAQEAHWMQPGKVSILAGWDARMDQIYWGVYKVEHERVRSKVPDQLSYPGDISIQDSDSLAAGNAWAVYREALSKDIQDLSTTEKDCYPSAKALAFLAVDLFEQGKAISPERIELDYLRNEVAKKRTQ